jgi:hypothetical protein
MADTPRRFPAPWHADPMPGGYVVRDANGKALAYVYSDPPIPCPLWWLLADKVIHVIEPDRADQNQIDRDNIVQERWLH